MADPYKGLVQRPVRQLELHELSTAGQVIYPSSYSYKNNSSSQLAEVRQVRAPRPSADDKAGKTSAELARINGDFTLAPGCNLVY